MSSKQREKPSPPQRASPTKTHRVDDTRALVTLTTPRRDGAAVEAHTPPALHLPNASPKQRQNPLFEHTKRGGNGPATKETTPVPDGTSLETDTGKQRVPASPIVSAEPGGPAAPPAMDGTAQTDTLTGLELDKKINALEKDIKPWQSHSEIVTMMRLQIARTAQQMQQDDYNMAYTSEPTGVSDNDLGALVAVRKSSMDPPPPQTLGTYYFARDRPTPDGMLALKKQVDEHLHSVVPTLQNKLAVLIPKRQNDGASNVLMVMLAPKHGVDLHDPRSYLRRIRILLAKRDKLGEEGTSAAITSLEMVMGDRAYGFVPFVKLYPLASFTSRNVVSQSMLICHLTFAAPDERTKVISMQPDPNAILIGPAQLS